jgi:lipopolysaccharide/colanic/teichoic acid biosynthesis glycosyltransferase
VPLPRTWYLRVRSTLEFLAALCLLVLTAPLVLLAALAVKATSRGPVFYAQVRLGRGGRPYTMYKIRSMYHDSERLSGPCWSTDRDPRVTPVGRVLRLTHVDELPQLWNVLRGEMSLIGPRPERPEFVPHLERAVPRYRERLRVRPGLTGLAQVQLPADSDLESVRRKLAYDLYYIEAVGAWLDLRILVSTALKMVGVPFPVLRKTFAMPTREEVEDCYWRAAPGAGGAPQVQPA